MSMGMGMAHHHEHDESGAVVSRAQRSTKLDDPGSAVHHFVPHRLRETPSGFCGQSGRI